MILRSQRISLCIVAPWKIQAGAQPAPAGLPAGPWWRRRTWGQSKSGAQRAIVDQCQFGRPYRKRTAFWGFPSGLLDGVARVCPGDHVHVTLSGWRPREPGSRSSTTPQATNQGSSAYPALMCTWLQQRVLENLGDRQ